MWVGRWRSSGLSVARFASRHRLNESTFYRWCQGSGTTARRSRSVGLGFTEVKVGEADAEEAGVLEIALPGGRAIRLRGKVDGTQLRAVLDVLGA